MEVGSVQSLDIEKIQKIYGKLQNKRGHQYAMLHIGGLLLTYYFYHSCQNYCEWAVRTELSFLCHTDCFAASHQA